MVSKSFIEVLNKECNRQEELINTGCIGIKIEEASGLLIYFMEMNLPFKVCPQSKDTVLIELLN